MISHDRRAFVAMLALSALVLLAPPAAAESPAFFTTEGVAINGFDPVAYFTQGEAVPGRPTHAVMWKGAIWLFASARNREAFEMNPRAYAPRFGGYCAYAVSRGQLASTDPQAWRIHDGQLFLIHSPEVYNVWARDVDGNIAKARANWPAVLRH